MRKGLGILIALGLCFSFLPIHAEESAAITSRLVEAVVHADKTITVSETIRLRLPEHETYDLFLELPDDAVARAEDVSLLSRQAVLDPQWNQVKVNRDQDVQLQLNYTLRCFQDDEADRDTFSLDLGRSPLDLPVEQMHAEIQFDSGLIRDNWLLDCGQSGGQCRYGTGKWQDQTFVFDSTDVLDYPTLNLIVHFDEGTFAKAQSYRWPSRYSRWHVEVEVLPQMDLQVYQELEWTSQSSELDPMLDLFLGWPSYPDALLKDVVISDPSLKASEYGFIRLPKDKPVALTLDYRIELASSEDQWHLNFDDAMNDAQIDELDVVIQLPQELKFRTDFYNSRTYEDLEKVTLDVSEDGRLLHLYSTEGLSGDDRVSVEIDIPRHVRRMLGSDLIGFWSMFGVGMVLASGLFRFLSRSTKRRTLGELPNGVNPLQAALLTDKPIGAETLAAVVINWAARDYIQVEMQGHRIQLTRKRSLIHQPDWEKRFMRSLLNLEDGNTVTLDKNGLRSSACIQEACRQARQEKAQWRHKGLAGLRWLLIGLSVLPPVMITHILFPWAASDSVVYLFSLGLIAVTIAIGCLSAALGQGLKKTRWALAGLGFGWLILLIRVLAYFDPQDLPAVISFSSLLLGQLILWPMKPLNPEGARLLQQVRQWRSDLKQMPDSKLDDWLDRDPDYALKCYGYARTLGVGGLWKKRFGNRILPSLSTVTDMTGQPQRIEVLDRLFEQLTSSFTE